MKYIFLNFAKLHQHLQRKTCFQHTGLSFEEDIENVSIMLERCHSLWFSRMVVTPWENILKYWGNILNILPSDPALLRCIALAERYLPSKARAGARFLLIEYFKNIVVQVVQYFRIFIFAQIPSNINFNNINWYWQNAICKANVSARNNIDSTKRKTK